MARPKKSDQLAAKNNIEFVSPELLLADAEERRTRLKTLIVLGKERGYLTYAEINDHLPDDVQGSEQIDGIIGMINDMGIQVYEAVSYTHLDVYKRQVLKRVLVKNKRKN